MVVTPRPMTLEEFMALSEQEPPLEFADGVVTQKVSPKVHHSALQAELTERINRSARPKKVARAFPELRATFGGASHVPDIAVYRWDRIPRDASGRLAADSLVSPDITVEIASPGQSVNALVRRCLWYVDNGVAMALLVDPVDESVLAFHADGRVSGWSAGDRIDLSEILPDFQLTVEQLFVSLQ